MKIYFKNKNEHEVPMCVVHMNTTSTLVNLKSDPNYFLKEKENRTNYKIKKKLKRI